MPAVEPNPIERQPATIFFDRYGFLAAAALKSAAVMFGAGFVA
jgi:hypothetical protein